MRFLLAVLLGPSFLAAQFPVREGDKVRLTQTLPGEDPSRREGLVRKLGVDSAVLDLRPRKGGYGFATMTAAYSRLEVSVGTRRQTKEGAWLGLLGGVALGAIAGGVILPNHRHYEFSFVQGAVIGAVLLAPVGVVRGAAIGRRHTTDVWRPVVR